MLNFPKIIKTIKNYTLHLRNNTKKIVVPRIKDNVAIINNTFFLIRIIMLPLKPYLFLLKQLCWFQYKFT